MNEYWYKFATLSKLVAFAISWLKRGDPTNLCWLCLKLTTYELLSNSESGYNWCIALTKGVFPIIAPHEIIAPPPPLWYIYHDWEGGIGYLTTKLGGGGYNKKDPTKAYFHNHSDLKWKKTMSPYF